MLNKKRLLLTVISLLIITVTVLSMYSCNGQNTVDGPVSDTTTAQDTTTLGSQETEPPESPNLEFVKDGVVNFKLIRSDNATEKEIQYVAQFVKSLSDRIGIVIKTETDFLRRNETRSEDDDKTPAIIIGKTNYTASVEACNALTTYNTFSFTVSGNQLIIAAKDEAALSAAMLRAEDIIGSYADNGQLIVPRDISLSSSGINNMLKYVPICEYGRTTTVNSCGDYSDMVTVSGMTKEDYVAYIEDAKNFGLTVYSQNEIGNNLFTTFTKDELIMNVMFYNSDKKMYIIGESSKNTALPPLSDPKTGDYTTTLTQLGLEYNYDLDDPNDPLYFPSSKYQIGNAYIFRLSDGSFIIMDGGFNKDRNVKMLYDELKSLQKDPTEKITIAAWFFSHVHGDHIGCFIKFMDKYKFEVNLEYVIYNSGNDAQDAVAGSTANMESAAKAALRYLPSGRIIIARPGQKYVFRNMTVDMYMTSDLMPDKVKNGNSLCIAYRCVVEGQSFFFTGDSNTDESDRLVALYGSSLRSDFEQINHHGGNGCTNELHAAIDPIVVLWPLGEYDYFVAPNIPGKITLCQAEYNKYLYSKECRVKEIILAGHTTRRITLPYVFPITRVDPVQHIVYR